MDKFVVMIIDDIKDNIDVLTGILSDEYNVKATTNNTKAVELVKKLKPDIILLDIMMPEIDGYTICAELKKHPLTKNIPVIFVSALNEDIDEAYGLELGAVDYIKKPVNHAVVKARVKTHLSLHHQKQVLENRVSERTEDLRHAYLEIVNVLGRAAEFKDNETGNHVLRVGMYAYIISKDLGYDDQSAELLKHAAPMHDVGKIGIPDEVLLKPGKLDAEEWQVMTKHTTIGSEILGDHSNELMQIANTVALEHHEKFNGKGYPNHLGGEDISLNAKIVAVCDVFDALTSKRPYKEAWPDEKAVDLIKSESGQQFDPIVVEAFVNNLDKILMVKMQLSDEGNIDE